jgi:hypothetical protein
MTHQRQRQHCPPPNVGLGIGEPPHHLVAFDHAGTPPDPLEHGCCRLARHLRRKRIDGRWPARRRIGRRWKCRQRVGRDWGRRGMRARVRGGARVLRRCRRTCRRIRTRTLGRPKPIAELAVRRGDASFAGPAGGKRLTLPHPSSVTRRSSTERVGSLDRR